jgi:hypothetical protein
LVPVAIEYQPNSTLHIQTAFQDNNDDSIFGPLSAKRKPRVGKERALKEGSWKARSGQGLVCVAIRACLKAKLREIEAQSLQKRLSKERFAIAILEFMSGQPRGYQRQSMHFPAALEWAGTPRQAWPAFRFYRGEPAALRAGMQQACRRRKLPEPDRTLDGDICPCCLAGMTIQFGGILLRVLGSLFIIMELALPLSLRQNA